MVELTIVHPTSLTSYNLQPDLSMLSTEVEFNPSIFFLYDTHHSVVTSIDELPIDVYPLMSFTSFGLICTLLTSSPSTTPHPPPPTPQVPSFSIPYHYQIRHNSPYFHTINFFPYIVFECRHNIRNQPVSTAVSFPNSFCDITTIETHQHFGNILKDIFFDFFQDSMAL